MARCDGPNSAAASWQLCWCVYTPYAVITMVALKIVHSTAPAAVRPTIEGGDRCHALPPLDWRDDFRDLADCELIIGCNSMNCHSQVGLQHCQGCKSPD